MLVRANSSKESSHSTTSLDVEGKILQNQTSLMPPSGGGPKQNSGPTNSGNQQGTKVLVGIVVVFLVCHIGRLVIQVSLVFFFHKITYSLHLVKFICSEKATKFCEIPTLILTRGGQN